MQDHVQTAWLSIPSIKVSFPVHTKCKFNCCVHGSVHPEAKEVTQIQSLSHIGQISVTHVLWTKMFLEEQGIFIKETMVH